MSLNLQTMGLRVEVPRNSQLLIIFGEIAQLVEQVKNENILCIFSSPNKEIVSTKVTSKFHEKDRVVSSSLTLPTKCPGGGMADTLG